MTSYAIGQAAVASDPARFAYLFDPSLPVRAPTEEEAAEYAARAADPKWQDLYQPVDARLLTVSLPAAGALEPLPAAVPDPEPPAEAAENEPDTSQSAADKAQADSEVALRRWGVTETIPVATAAEDEASHVQ